MWDLRQPRRVGIRHLPWNLGPEPLPSIVEFVGLPDIYARNLHLAPPLAGTSPDVAFFTDPLGRGGQR